MKKLLVGCLFLAAGCVGPPVDQLNYTETKALVDELIKRCHAQNVPQNEMETCVRQEYNREASLRQEASDRRRALAARRTYCQVIGASVICY